MNVSLVCCLLCITTVVVSYNVEVDVNVDLSANFFRNRNKPRDCIAAKRFSGHSRAVNIYPENNTPLRVFCDQDTDGGGWVVFQRRKDGSVDFYRNWTSYQSGFGDVTGEFWLGLDALHTLTSRQRCQLRVDLMKWDGTKGYATYSNFTISDSSDNYRMRFGSFTGGNAGDSLTFQQGQQFTTKERDHDTRSGTNCAAQFHGAWWYASCYQCSLNGGYKNSSSDRRETGVQWQTFTGHYHSLKFSEMKIRAM